jgi:pSer/pThr/pTyr-binding forkhead associated (FHA) protein/S1-C subfamily serine protease
MPYLRLRDERTGEIREFDCSEVRIGRDPESEWVVEGEGRKVVSGHHARFIDRDGSWWIEDLGSRNGTFLNDSRLEPGTALRVAPNSLVRLGMRGPTYLVQVVAQSRVSSTLHEADLPPVSSANATVPLDAIGPPLAAGLSPEPVLAVLYEASGERQEVRGRRIRIGRARECEMRPVGLGDTSVSRMHAEVEFPYEGGVVIRDLGSRNGTLLNGAAIEDESPLAVGDRVKLGATGPEFLVESLEGVRASAAALAASEPREQVRASSPRRSYGGKGATIFFQDLIEESSRKTRARTRWVVWTVVVLLAGAVGGMYWVSEVRVRRTEAQLEEQARLLAEQRAIADSLQRAAEGEYQRLRQELDAAREAAAPVAVLDSLRQALTEARERTDALETALQRAQVELNRQLALGDSMQRAAQQELARVRADLSRASGSQETALLDSLRQAVRQAEEQAGAIEGALRAVRGSDLSTVVQANQGAIGLVTAVFGGDHFEGSGFVLTPSGYFVTNRHVVTLDDRRPDSLYVTMNQQRRMLRSDIVNIGDAAGPDLAVLKIRNYSGQHVVNVDWTGQKIRQGEPAAMIGFPAGMAMALDRSLTVRASVNAGIISKVTSDFVQFDGFTISGSSGSPIFNGNGEIIAVHRAGLKEAVGMGFAVPIKLLIPLLPPQAKGELGLR